MKSLTTVIIPIGLFGLVVTVATALGQEKSGAAGPTSATRQAPAGRPSATDRLEQTIVRRPLQPCRLTGVEGEARCGTYEVYEDRTTRSGRKIALNIVVLPAEGAPPAPDPLFILVGGPGQAATESAAGFARQFATLRRTRDLVLVDQRGTGQSNKLPCDIGQGSEAVKAILSGVIPAERVRACRTQLEKQADLKFYITPFAMDDVDEVRAWLGYRQINLYGGSYGTYAALVYLSRHPGTVRTVTSRAVFAPTLLNTLQYSQQALDRLFEDCAREEACRQAYPNLRADFRKVLDRLAQSPAKLPRKLPSGETAEIPITRADFAGAVRRMLYDAHAQRSVPAVVAKAQADDFSFLQEVGSQVLGLLGSLSLGLNLTINCAEGVSRYSPEEVAREGRETFLGDTLANGLSAACKEWPTGGLAVGPFSPVRSDVPVLILSGALDPVSSPAAGAEVARHLPNSLRVVMEGVAHSPFPPCAVGIMSRFVAAGSVRDLDTACVKELRRAPFIVPK